MDSQAAKALGWGCSSVVQSLPSVGSSQGLEKEKERKVSYQSTDLNHVFREKKFLCLDFVITSHYC